MNESYLGNKSSIEKYQNVYCPRTVTHKSPANGASHQQENTKSKWYNKCSGFLLSKGTCKLGLQIKEYDAKRTTEYGTLIKL